MFSPWLPYTFEKIPRYPKGWEQKVKKQQLSPADLAGGSDSTPEIASPQKNKLTKRVRPSINHARLMVTFNSFVLSIFSPVPNVIYIYIYEIKWAKIRRIYKHIYIPPQHQFQLSDLMNWENFASKWQWRVLLSWPSSWQALRTSAPSKSRGWHLCHHKSLVWSTPCKGKQFHREEDPLLVAGLQGRKPCGSKVEPAN